MIRRISGLTCGDRRHLDSEKTGAMPKHRGVQAHYQPIPCKRGQGSPPWVPDTTQRTADTAHHPRSPAVTPMPATCASNPCEPRPIPRRDPTPTPALSGHALPPRTAATPQPQTRPCCATRLSGPPPRCS